MADKKISQLNAAATIYDADDFAVVQDGETVQTNAIVVKTYVRGGIDGAVVGTTDTQTLTNKTLTAPTINGGSVLDLAQLTVDGNTTLGDASTDTLTINGTAVSAPNGLNVNSNQLVLSSGNVGIGSSTVPFTLGKQLTVQFGNTTAVATSVGITCGGYSAYADSMVSVIESFGARNDGNTTFGGRFGAAYRRADGTVIAAGALVGVYAFGGQWGTDTSYQSAKMLYPASIIGIAEGNFTAANAMPMGLSFRTGSTGQSLGAVNTAYGTERLRISSTGVVTIGSAISLDPTTANALVVNSSGNVGIGTSSISAKLQVNVSAAAKALILTDTVASDCIFTPGVSSGVFRIGPDNGALALYAGTSIGVERARITAAGDFISTVNGTAPSLSTNGTMVFALTSNTNLRISVRGTDGTTRVANITLA